MNNRKIIGIIIVLVGIDVFASNPNYPPAHYRTTAFPGKNDNVGIVVHRTGPDDYFRHLDKLEKGVHEYIVERVFIVDPSDNYVIKGTDYGVLRLTDCKKVEVRNLRLE